MSQCPNVPMSQCPDVPMSMNRSLESHPGTHAMGQQQQPSTRKEFLFVLDRSGSMAGAPLTLVKRAAEFVVDHLGDGDKVGGGRGVRAGGGGTEEEDKEEMLFVPFKSCSLATTKTSTKYNCHNR